MGTCNFPLKHLILNRHTCFPVGVLRVAAVIVRHTPRVCQHSPVGLCQLSSQFIETPSFF